jgi:hypothetical protein
MISTFEVRKYINQILRHYLTLRSFELLFGNVQGFSILGLSKLVGEKPVIIDLHMQAV